MQRIEGKIIKVHTDAPSGYITGLTLENGSLLEGDLFLDCTGMRSLLLGETLGVGYQDWSHWLPCDTAVAVQTASVREAVPFIQKAATRLVQLFPADGICQSDIDEFNQQTQTSIETIRDFIILHYHVTNRTDSPLWRHCREMAVPPLLKHRVQQFRDSGRVSLSADELFAENSWVQVMLGQGIVPRSHHPITRQMDDRNLSEFLGDIRKDVARTLMKLPKHHSFVEQFARAGAPADAAPAHAKAAVAPNPTGVTLRLNPAPQLQTLTLSTGARVFVVDDFLLNPDDAVALAETVAPHFHNLAGHPYPGPQLLLPEALSAQLDAFFQQHCAGPLQVGRPLGMYARYSRVTLDPAQLDPRQRVCHRDDTGLDPSHAMAAMVHYLFPDEALGGTVFFRSLMSDAGGLQFRRDANSLDGAAFEAKYGVAAGYMTQSNHYFEVIGRVPAKWNRAIFYDGGIFHSGDILWSSPAAYQSGLGRLTLNAFFKSLKSAA